MSEQPELTQLCRCADPIRCEMANRIRELEAEVAGWKRAYDVDCSRLIERAEAAEAEVARKDAALLESQQMMLDEQEKRQAAEAEVADLKESGLALCAAIVKEAPAAEQRIRELEAEAMDMSNAYTVLEQKNHDLKTKNALWKESFDRINRAHDSAVQRIAELEALLKREGK